MPLFYKSQWFSSSSSTAAAEEQPPPSKRKWQCLKKWLLFSRRKRKTHDMRLPVSLKRKATRSVKMTETSSPLSSQLSIMPDSKELKIVDPVRPLRHEQPPRPFSCTDFVDTERSTPCVTPFTPDFMAQYYHLDHLPSSPSPPVGLFRRLSRLGPPSPPPTVPERRRAMSVLLSKQARKRDPLLSRSFSLSDRVNNELGMSRVRSASIRNKQEKAVAQWKHSVAQLELHKMTACYNKQVFLFVGMELTASAQNRSH